MASLKSEFLSHYQEIHGTPLRSRAFGAIRALNRAGAALAPVSNLAPRLPGARAVLERTLGIARERPLPHFERETLLRWDARRSRTGAPAPRGDVVLLADSFTTFTEPAIGRAAVELLERAGWRVRLQTAGCCGRASLSKGLLARAPRMGRAVGDPPPAPRRGGGAAERRRRAVVPADAARRVPRAAPGRRARRGRRRAVDARRRPARPGDRPRRPRP